MKRSDDQLLAAIKFGGNQREEATRYIYCELNLRPRITGFLVKKGCGEADALDIYQDIIILFIEKVKKDEFLAKSSIENFIFSLAKHKWLNLYRKHKKTIRMDIMPDTDYEPSVAESMLCQEDLKNDLTTLLDQLKEKCRTLLTYFSEGYKINEIANKMDFKDARACTKAKYKCIQNLKNYLLNNPTLSASLFENLKMND